MSVPNHERKTFRDMTPKERSALVESTLKGNTEWFDTEGWRPAASNFVALDGIYRTRPRQLVIPWEVIKPEYKWAVVDAQGRVYFHEDRPEISYGAWVSEHPMRNAGALNIDTTGIDWRESLTARPEGV